MAEALLIGAIGGALYTRLTSYDDLAEIKSNTLAAGFPSAGILLAVGVVMEAAVAGGGVLVVCVGGGVGRCESELRETPRSTGWPGVGTSRNSSTPPLGVTRLRTGQAPAMSAVSSCARTEQLLARAVDNSVCPAVDLLLD